MFESWITAIADRIGEFPKPAPRRRCHSSYAGVEHLEERILLAAHVWDGGSILNDKWTTAKNWVNDIAPVAGDELVFPDGVGITDRSTNNDFATDTPFKNITIQGSDYKFTGNRIKLTGDVAFHPLSDTFAIDTKLDLDIRFAGGIHQISSSGNVSSNLIFNGRLSDDGSPGKLVLTSSGFFQSFIFGGPVANQYHQTIEVDALPGVVGRARLELNKADNVPAIAGPLVVGVGADVVSGTHLPIGLGAQTIGQMSSGIPVTVNIGGTLAIAKETLGKIDLIGGTIEIKGDNGRLTILNTLTASGLNPKIQGSPGTTLALSSTNSGAVTQQINVVGGVQLAMTVQLFGIGLEKTGFGKLILQPLAGNNLHKSTFVTQGSLIVKSTVPGQTVIPNSLFIGNAGFAADVLLDGTNEVIANSVFVDVSNLGRLGLTNGAKETIASLAVGPGNNNNAQLRLDGPSALTVTGNTTLQNFAFVNVAPGSALTFLGNATLNKGATLINAGFVDLRKDFILNGGGMFTQTGGRTLLTGNVNVLPSDRTAEISGDLELKAGVHELIVADNAPLADIVITAKIHNEGNKVANAATFRKRGAGTALFTADNNYTGSTFLFEGTLTIEGQLPLSRVVVDATLAGLGIVGDVVMNGNPPGVINPGSIGVATAMLTAKSLNTGVNAKLHFDINGTTPATQFDQLKIVGGTAGTPVQIGAGTILELNVGFNAALGTSFKIIDNIDARAVTGLFKDPQGNVLNEGATLTANGQAFTISYQGSDGNDVVVTRNTAPAFQHRAITPKINEGDIATLTGLITEPDATDKFFLDVNWGDGYSQTYEIPPDASRSVSVTHLYANDPVGKSNVYHVHLVWRDDHGGSNHAELWIQVKNVAPMLSNFAVTAPQAGSNSPVTASGLINDPGVQDVITVRVQWDRLSPWETYTFAPGTQHFNLTHHYTRVGHHRVTVAVADGDGGVATRRQWIHVPPW